jgi:SH3-like domain-containing protein
VSSKAAASVKSLRRVAVVTAVVVAALASTAGTTMPGGRPTPTGLEVPRWISLKSDKVSARQGPGMDYKILWQYRARHLPVQVIAETREWRKICDPDGSVAWIHRTVASGRRAVFNPETTELAVRTGRSDMASLRARLSPRSIVSLDSCKDGWCRIQARKVKGWVRADSVFGTADRPLCDARRAAG